MEECKIICERILEMLEAKETAQVPAIEFLPVLGGIRSSPKKKALKTPWTRRRSRCLATWSTSTTSTLTSTLNLSYDSHSTLQLLGGLCRRILLDLGRQHSHVSGIVDDFSAQGPRAWGSTTRSASWGSSCASAQSIHRSFCARADEAERRAHQRARGLSHAARAGPARANRQTEGSNPSSSIARRGHVPKNNNTCSERFGRCHIGRRPGRRSR
jgi:hypothetical protein